MYIIGIKEVRTMKYAICGDLSFIKKTTYCQYNAGCFNTYRVTSSRYTKSVDVRDGTVCGTSMTSCFC